MICRICGCTENARRFIAREMMFGSREQFDYFQCSSCGCLQIAQIPKDLHRYYPKDYYSFCSPQLKQAHGAAVRWLQKQRSRTAIFGTGFKLNSIAKRFVDLPAAIGPFEGGIPIGEMIKKCGIRTFSANIIDIGCGAYSHWLAALAKLGFKRLLGIDPFAPEPELRYDGFLVRRLSVEEVSGTFDLVTMHHALEHMPDQIGTLRRVASILRENGTCIVRIPIVSSDVWERYGINWVELDAPRHLFLHSLDSISILSESAGLEVFDIVHDSLPLEFYGSELYSRDIPLTDPRSPWVNPKSTYFSSSEMERFAALAVEANRTRRGGRAGIYLRHKSSR